MIKRIISLLLCALFLLGLTACGETKGKDAQLIFPIDTDPLFLDPQIISHTGAKNIILNCFEGLVTLGEDSSIKPGMAESWAVSEDGLTYTFKLRSDSRWRVTSAALKRVLGEEYTLYPTYDEKGKLKEPEEGKEIFDITVSAYDFDFGITRALLPETKSPSAYKLYSIKNAEEVNKGKMKKEQLGVEALDKSTLRITLEKADEDFLYTLLEPACMPCNEIFFEKTGGRYGLATRYLIYNGPFYINNWADNSSVSVRKNSDYYYDAENVMPYSVYFSINDEQDTRLRKLKNDTYDISPFTKSQAAEVVDKKDYTINSFSSSIEGLLFNCEDEYLKSEKIRKAIASTFDKKVFESEKGNLTAEGVFPRSLLVGNNPYADLDSRLESCFVADPQKMFKSGLEDLEKSTATITLLCKKEDEVVARRLLQAWQASLGIIFNISVEPVDEFTLEKRIKKGDYQLALGKITFSGNSVFDSALKFTSESRDNTLNLKNKTYDKLAEKISLSSGLLEKLKAINKAEQYLISSAAIIPLYEEKSYVVSGPGVSGVMFNKTGDVLYFKNTLEK